jgi:hypothetical protein
MLALLLVAAVWAAPPAGADQSAATGTDVKASAPSPSEPALRPGCSKVVSDSRVAVGLDPETLWRPRDSEVRFIFDGGNAGVSVSSVQVTFGWSEGSAAGRNKIAGFYDCKRSPLVRSIPNQAGDIEFGAVVPGLLPVPTNWPIRFFEKDDPVSLTGLYIVPVALMTVTADVTFADKTTKIVVAVLPIGVTSVHYAVALVIVALLAIAIFIYWVLRKIEFPGTDPVLRLITGADGWASLSQFQIILWTLVVGGSAIYVMALSGNLIGITGGTLTLLGIAGASALLSRASETRRAKAKLAAQRAALARDKAAASDAEDKLAAAQAALAKAQTAERAAAQEVADQATKAAEDARAAVKADTAGEPRHVPSWSDLVVVDAAQGIDVTRIQMLIFTCVSAAFVALKVGVNYEIPDIPDGYVLLMGISNGVYIAGKQIPDSSSSGKTDAASS